MFPAWLKDNMSLWITSSPKDPIEWTWSNQDDTDFVDVFNDNRDVAFHKKHSSGTAVVRGTAPMTHDQHFWEIQMISPVYGTDMMVGIGTSEADVSQLPDCYESRLGKDSSTWGFSYTGNFHHNGEIQTISSSFDQGSIIGMHLDLWNGTLSFYKNKKHLGVASKGLNGKTLYAMASSTAACSGMRILKSCSFPSSLQFLCCAKLRDLIPDDKGVLNELPLPPGMKFFLRNNLGWLLSPRLHEEHPCRNLNPKITRCLPHQIPDSLRELQTSAVRYALHVPDPETSFIMVGQPNVVQPRVVLQDLNPSQRRNLLHRFAGRPISSFTQAFEVSNFSDEVLDDEDDSESEPKRRKYSYNYIIGLSDHESDAEL